jgi:hypothetical protein
VNSYEQKKAARIERLRARADKTGAEGAAKYESGRARLERIPFGQPIHVGHHSERGDRNYRAKACGAIEKGFELLKESDRLDARADAAERNTAISSDDPEALVKLRTQLAEATTRADEYAAGIKAARKVPEPWTAESLAAAGVCADVARYCILMRHLPTAANVRAEVRRLAERIKLLEERAASPVAAPETFGAIEVSEDREANRVRITFPGRVSAEVYKLLKGSGFKHARSVGEHVWQRQTSGQAWYEARCVARKASEA